MLIPKVKVCGPGVCRACDGIGKIFLWIGVKDGNSTSNETEEIYEECLRCKGTGQEPFQPSGYKVSTNPETSDSGFNWKIV